MSDCARDHYRIEVTEESGPRRALRWLASLAWALLESPEPSTGLEIVVIDTASGEELRRINAPLTGADDVEGSIRHDLDTLDQRGFAERWLRGASDDG